MISRRTQRFSSSYKKLKEFRIFFDLGKTPKTNNQVIRVWELEILDGSFIAFSNPAVSLAQRFKVLDVDIFNINILKLSEQVARDSAGACCHIDTGVVLLEIWQTSINLLNADRAIYLYFLG